MTQCLAVLFVLTLVFGNESQASTPGAGPNGRCQQIFRALTKSIQTQTLKFIREVRETKGRRLFLIEHHRELEEKTKWAGLFTRREIPADPFGRGLDLFANGLPRLIARAALPRNRFSDGYLFTPFSFANRWLLDKPVIGLSGLLSTKTFRPAILSVLPATLFFLTATMELVADPLTRNAYNSAIAENVLNNEDAIRQALSTDFRFQALREAMDLKTVTEEQALTEAMYLMVLIDDYSMGLATNGNSFLSLNLEQQIEQFGQNPLFKNVSDAVTFGIQPSDSLRAKSRSSNLTVSAAEHQQLFIATHKMLGSMKRIDQLTATLLNPGRSNPQLVSAITGVVDNEFERALLIGVAELKLTPLEFKYLMQRDAHYTLIFETYRILGYESIGANGQALSIEDLRQSTLSDFRARGS